MMESNNTIFVRTSRCEKKQEQKQNTPKEIQKKTVQMDKRRFQERRQNSPAELRNVGPSTSNYTLKTPGEKLLEKEKIKPQTSTSSRKFCNLHVNTNWNTGTKSSCSETWKNANLSVEKENKATRRHTISYVQSPNGNNDKKCFKDPWCSRKVEPSTSNYTLITPAKKLLEKENIKSQRKSCNLHLNTKNVQYPSRRHSMSHIQNLNSNDNKSFKDPWSGEKIELPYSASTFENDIQRSDTNRLHYLEKELRNLQRLQDARYSKTNQIMIHSLMQQINCVKMIRLAVSNSVARGDGFKGNVNDFTQKFTSISTVFGIIEAKLTDSRCGTRTVTKRISSDESEFNLLLTEIENTKANTKRVGGKF